MSRRPRDADVPLVVPLPVARAVFGRVRVRMEGCVMLVQAVGPFDSDLIAATRRAVQSTLKRMPALRRFVQLVELQDSCEIAESALSELSRFVDEQVGLGFLPYSTVLQAPDDLPHRDHLEGVVRVMSPTRPVHILSTGTQAWAQVNADLQAAGLPVQDPPLGSAAAREIEG